MTDTTDLVTIDDSGELARALDLGQTVNQAAALNAFGGYRTLRTLICARSMHDRRV
jgi:hypothetical protein